jgi:hypothetical protein
LVAASGDVVALPRSEEEAVPDARLVRTSEMMEKAFFTVVKECGDASEARIQTEQTRAATKTIVFLGITMILLTSLN